ALLPRDAPPGRLHRAGGVRGHVRVDGARRGGDQEDPSGVPGVAGRSVFGLMAQAEAAAERKREGNPPRRVSRAVQPQIVCVAAMAFGAVTIGAVGSLLTVALVVPPDDAHPLTVAVTEYIPLAATVAFEIDGFCCDDVKPLGPIHAYVALETNDAVRFSVWPA